MKQTARRIECPHCHHEIKVAVRVEIVDLAIPEDDLIDCLQLTESGKIAMKNVRENGLIDVFASVVSYVKGHDTPHQMEQYFLTFIQTSNSRMIPRFALDYFIETFENGRVQFWQGQGIGVIVVDDIIRAFIPLETVLGPSLKNGEKWTKVRSGDTTKEALVEWLSRDGVKLKPEQFVSFSQLRKTIRDGLIVKL